MGCLSHSCEILKREKTSALNSISSTVSASVLISHFPISCVEPKELSEMLADVSFEDDADEEEDQV